MMPEQAKDLFLVAGYEFNLAEATAESIKANPLLVRVGAYYHDIGKIRRPEYYVENQRGLQNQHEKIAPELSAMIIIAHYVTALRLSRKSICRPI